MFNYLKIKSKVLYMKTQIDIDIDIIKTYVTSFKGNQHTRFRQQILEGQKTNNLAFKLFNVSRKLLINNKVADNNNQNDTIIDLQNKIDKLEQEKNELNTELSEAYTVIDNLDNYNMELKNKYNIIDRPNIKMDITPSVFDVESQSDPETDDEYDPYNEKPECTPLKITDYNSMEIMHAMMFHGMSANEWNDNNEVNQLQMMNQYKLSI